MVFLGYLSSHIQLARSWNNCLIVNNYDAGNNNFFPAFVNLSVHGSVHVWGYSKACGAKTDVLSPVHVFSSSESNGIQDLAGGDSHSMILTSDGILYSWGNNFEVRKTRRYFYKALHI